MTEHTSGQLEQEAEQIRAGIAHTAEALQDRMSPGKLIDEFMTYMKDSDGALALDNLGRQARDNPMALAMIGSGFAWLAFGNGMDREASGRFDTSAYRTNRHPMSSAGVSGSQPEATWEGGGHSGAASTVDDAAAGVAAKVNGLADRAKDAVADGADQIRDAATDAAHRARRMQHDATDRGHAAAENVRDMADRGRRSVMDALDREPLVLGAIGIAVGAALGAMLPGTRFENEAFGDTREAMIHDAKEAVDRAAESARKIGGEALDAARSASKDEGLIVEGKPVTERLADVAKAAVSAGEDAAAREAEKTAQSSASTATSTNPAPRPFG